MVLVTTPLVASGAEPEARGAQGKERKETAQALFEQGFATAEAGDCVRAIPLFRRSQALYAARGTLLNLALCEKKVGRVASAWRHLQDALAALPPDDPRRQLAQEELAALEPRVPRLRIEIVAGSPLPEQVVLDGVEVAIDRLDSELPVDPGQLVLQVTWPGGGQEQLQVMVAEGARETARLSGDAEPSLLPPRPVLQRSDASGDASSAPLRPRWPAAVAAGVAVTGLATGVVFTLAANQRSAQADAALREAVVVTPRDQRVCPTAPSSPACARVRELLGEQDTFQNLAVTGYVFGGVAAAGAVVLGIWSYQQSGTGAGVRLAPTATLHGGGLQVAGRF